MTDEFSVYQFLECGTSECVRDRVSAREALETAASYTTRPAAVMGIIKRVIITDGGDMTCFEWINGKGVIFPQPPSTVPASDERRD